MKPPRFLYSVESMDKGGKGVVRPWDYHETHTSMFKDSAVHTAQQIAGPFYDVTTYTRVGIYKRIGSTLVGKKGGAK